MRLFFVLFCVTLTANASPVIYILYNKYLDRAKLLSSAIIATEKFLVTTKYPFRDYAKSDLCALPVLNLKMSTVEQHGMSRKCINITDVHDTRQADIVILELEKPIVFHLYVDAAQIPLVNDVSIKNPLNLLQNCVMVVNKRNSEDVVTQQELVSAEIVGSGSEELDKTDTHDDKKPDKNKKTNKTDDKLRMYEKKEQPPPKKHYQIKETPPEEPDDNLYDEKDINYEHGSIVTREIKEVKNSVKFITVTLNDTRKFCLHDSGMPLICEAAVVGIFKYDSETNNATRCCMEECSLIKQIQVVKLYDKDVQALLARFVDTTW